MSFFKEMKRRAQFNSIERKKNRILTRQNIAMKIRSIPGDIKSSYNLWRYNLVNDIKEIKNLKGSLRLGLWLSMIGIVIVWALFYGQIYTRLNQVISYSMLGGEQWIAFTKEIAVHVPFIPNFAEIMQSLGSPLLGNTVIGWISALIMFVGRFIIWCVPAFILVNHYSKTKGIRSYSRMFRRPFSLKYCWGSFVVILAWILITAVPEFIREGKFFITPQFQPIDLLVTVLTVTVTEEILLRGWFLNALNTRGGPVYSSFVVTIFYLLLLLPKWIDIGLFSYPLSLMIVLIVTFVITFALCIAFNRSRSIWTSIVLRGFWALCSVLLPSAF